MLGKVPRAVYPLEADQKGGGRVRIVRLFRLFGRCDLLVRTLLFPQRRDKEWVPGL